MSFFFPLNPCFFTLKYFTLKSYSLPYEESKITLLFIFLLCFSHFLLYDISSLSLYACAHVCLSFGNCDISDKERTIMHVVRFIFETELLAILLISRHIHIISLQRLLLYQFSSSFPLPFLFKYPLIFDIYA